MTTGSPRPGEEIRDDLTSVYMVAILITMVGHMRNRSHRRHIHTNIPTHTHTHTYTHTDMTQCIKDSPEACI